MKLNVPVVGLLSSAENMPGAAAYRPGDILTMYNGVTVEVTNTDAEGRLVLADALAWGIETYQPRAVVNLATLTGACIVALGPTTAGAWCNDDALYSRVGNRVEIGGREIVADAAGGGVPRDAQGRRRRHRQQRRAVGRRLHGGGVFAPLS